MTALAQPSLADTVRSHCQRATLNPASIAPSARMTRVTTPVNVGPVNETFCGFVENASFSVFKGVKVKVHKIQHSGNR